MTKQDSVVIKNVIKGYPVYFQSKTGKLRVRAYTYTCNYDKVAEDNAILNLLKLVSDSGHRPQFDIEHKTYQGFIHDTYIVFQ